MNISGDIMKLLQELTGMLAEGSDASPWRVEQSDATGRYYVVKGYYGTRKVWANEIGAIDFNKKEDAEAKAEELNKPAAESSEIKVPTEDGITMQDIRLMAGEGKLTQKTIKQAIEVIRKQRKQRKEKQGVAEGFKNTYSVGDRVDGPLGTGTIVAVSKNINVDGRVKVKLDDPSRAGEDGKYKDSFVLNTTQLKHISEQGVSGDFREAPGMHSDEDADKVKFEIGGYESTADAALDAVWSRFKHDIEFADEGSEVMVISRKYWEKVQELAQDAGGWAEEVGGEQHAKD